MKYLFSLLILSVLFLGKIKAHPMPNSVLLLDIKQESVSAKLKWPLKEFQLVFPNEDLDTSVNTLLSRKGAWLDDYLKQHMSVTDSQGHAWAVIINSKSIDTSRQSYTGKFNELTFNLTLQPPPGTSTRHFIIHYDAIMHQLVTHKMLVRIAQDWDGGLSTKDSTNADLGMLMMNISNNTVPPLIINLDDGNRWKGFRSMVSLGISHISEGTDHLLFLLVLMLPAPLIAFKGRWTKSGGTKYSAIRLLKIATAFTIGHSITLLAGAIGWLRIPSQPVEILIALSILIGAIHALRPVFPGKEVFVASGFGLVHGLAFAGTLATLNLDGSRMALSILGFNIGIELMQLFVILLFVPWLVMLSRYRFYHLIRIAGAVFALIASLAWITERVIQHPNKFTPAIQHVAAHGQWIILSLAVIAIITYFIAKPNNEQLTA